jgi:hypothetical protein
VLQASAARIALSPIALRLDGVPAGDLTFIQASSGGTVFADVQSTTLGGDHFAHKQPGLPRNEDVIVRLGTSMSEALFDWIAGSWGPTPETRDGAVLGCDHKFKVRRERQFHGAVVAETTFPTLDAASKQAGALTVRIRSAGLSPETDPGTPLVVPIGPGAKQKLWLASNFKLQIAGLDCSKVSRIEAFTVRRSIDTITSASGDVSLQAGPVDFPNLRITLSTASAATWAAWHQDFIVNGNNGPGSERTGSLSILAPNLQTELARIELLGLGIVRFAPEAAADGVGSVVGRMTAELYCEQMQLLPGGAP